MILPMRPKGSEGLTEEELSMLVTRDSLMGVGTGISLGDPIFASNCVNYSTFNWQNRGNPIVGPE